MPVDQYTRWLPSFKFLRLSTPRNPEQPEHQADTSKISDASRVPSSASKPHNHDNGVPINLSLTSTTNCSVKVESTSDTGDLSHADDKHLAIMPPKRSYHSFEPRNTIDDRPSATKTHGGNPKPRMLERHALSAPPMAEHKRKRESSPANERRSPIRQQHHPGFAFDVANSRGSTKQSSTTSNTFWRRESVTTRDTAEHTRQNSSIISVGEYNRKKGEKTTPLGSLNEYATLDGMMKPAGLKSSKRRKRSDQGGKATSSFSTSPSITDFPNSNSGSYVPRLNLIDLEGDSVETLLGRDDQSNTGRDEGSHRLTRNSTHWRQVSEEILDEEQHKDPHDRFHRRARANGQSSAWSPNARITTDYESISHRPRRSESLRHQPRLQEQFKRDCGSQSDDTDELSKEAANHNSEWSRKWSHKSRRDNGKSNGERVSRDAKYTIVSSQDIKPTEFFSSRSPYSQQKTSGNTSEWRSPDRDGPLSLSAFHSFDLDDEGPGITIARDQINHAFMIYRKDKKLTEIQSKYISKVICSERMLHFRLLGPRTDGPARIEYYLTFTNSEDGGVFRYQLSQITKQSIKEETRSESHVISMCQKWRSTRAELAERQRKRESEQLELEQDAAKQRAQRAEQQQKEMIPSRSTQQSKPDKDLSPLETTFPHHSRYAPISSSDLEPRNTRLRQRFRVEGLETQPSIEHESSGGEHLAKYSISHGLGEHWKNSLAFPKNGVNRATVEFSDLPRLDDGEFLNDSLISFWLRDLDKDVYIFNTFFYTSLTKAIKGKKGINYDLVKRWTTKVDLFNYDFVVVPINENIHWYVAIICNLRNAKRHIDIEEVGCEKSISQTERVSVTPDRRGAEAADIKSIDFSAHRGQPVQDARLVEQTSQLAIDQEDEVKPEHSQAASSAMEIDEEPPSPANTRKQKKRKSVPLRKIDPDKPVIITLDSFGLGHSPVVKNLKDYLREEGRAKRNMDVEIQQNGVTAKGIPLQDNYYDCGLYVLFYIAKFLEGPRDFVTKILQRELDGDQDWPKVSSSDMRTAIRDTIQAEHRKQEQGSKVSQSVPGESRSVMAVLTGSKSKKRDEYEIDEVKEKGPVYAARGESVSPSRAIGRADKLISETLPGTAVQSAALAEESGQIIDAMIETLDAATGNIQEVSPLEFLDDYSILKSRDTSSHKTPQVADTIDLDSEGEDMEVKPGFDRQLGTLPPPFPENPYSAE